MDHLRDKNGTRDLGRFSSEGICELYRISLEQRIAQGDIDLVCGDEELFRRVEGMLKEGDPRKVLTAPGLDTLATMEDSLQALPIWGHSVGGITDAPTAPGLGVISTAFKVLEQATLNLYLCPWRKEYRVVKVYSGMFTHLVRPALSEQQVAQLFGLLGYQVQGAQLELRGTPPSAAALLDLACAFFAARCESRLLSTAAAVSGGRPGAELALVQERQKGRSLQEALESLQGKTQDLDWGYREGMDLYTADGEGSDGETEVPSPGKEVLSTASMSRERAGGRSSTVPASSQSLRITLSKSKSQSTSESLGQDAKQAVPQTAEDGGMGAEQGQKGCACLSSPSFMYYDCLRCNELHTLHCDIPSSCRKKMHHLKLIDLDSTKNKNNPQLLADTAQPGHTEGGASTALWEEPNVGEDSANARNRPKVEKDSANARDRSKEGGASAARFGNIREGGGVGLGVGLGMTCDRQDCANFAFAFCNMCGNKICSNCWLHCKHTCDCGVIFKRFLASSV